MAKTKKILHSILQNQTNQRIDKILSLFPDIGSRTKAQWLIENNFIKINNKAVKASYLVQLDDAVEIEIPVEGSTSELTPYNIPLEILFEDDDLIVVNKPAPLVVHPAHGHTDKTLVNALMYHTKNLSMGFAENRPGIVHRLDKETSGLLVVAKNNFSQEFLAHQFKERTIQRKYWAICYGSFKEKNLRIETYLARHPTHRKKFASTDNGGKYSATNVTVLKESTKGVSLIECLLETGRTHQIRVHLSEKMHPILGDKLYGSDSKLSSIKSLLDRKKIESLNRIALHAKELGFIHPKTREHIFFESDFPECLSLLAKDLNLL